MSQLVLSIFNYIPKFFKSFEYIGGVTAQHNLLADRKF
ncbi:hypothetical protein OROMI_014331 [Orobanche minor]